jgi:hypothetical protein
MPLGKTPLDEKRLKCLPDTDKVAIGFEPLLPVSEGEFESALQSASPGNAIPVGIVFMPEATFEQVGASAVFDPRNFNAFVVAVPVQDKRLSTQQFVFLDANHNQQAFISGRFFTADTQTEPECPCLNVQGENGAYTFDLSLGDPDTGQHYVGRLVTPDEIAATQKALAAALDLPDVQKQIDTLNDENRELLQGTDVRKLVNQARASGLPRDNSTEDPFGYLAFALPVGTNKTPIINHRALAGLLLSPSSQDKSIRVALVVLEIEKEDGSGVVDKGDVFHGLLIRPGGETVRLEAERFIPSDYQVPQPGAHVERGSCFWYFTIDGITYVGEYEC